MSWMVHIRGYLCLYEWRPMMHSAPEGRFLRISNALFDLFLRARLAGAQWRVLLWVIRYTYGWNRRWTSFTWYRVAKELGLDRAAAYRAGQSLLRAGVLVLYEHQLGVQTDPAAWGSLVLSTKSDDARQLWMPGISVSEKQRQPLPRNNPTVVNEQRFGCQKTTLFRRAKYSSKDNLKTDKNRRKSVPAAHHTFRTGHTERLHLAGAAKPIPGKYDSLS
jgi:phage replication O-like protein O